MRILAIRNRESQLIINLLNIIQIEHCECYDLFGVGIKSNCKGQESF